MQSSFPLTFNSSHNETNMIRVSTGRLEVSRSWSWWGFSVLLKDTSAERMTDTWPDPGPLAKHCSPFSLHGWPLVKNDGKTALATHFVSFRECICCYEKIISKMYYFLITFVPFFFHMIPLPPLLILSFHIIHPACSLPLHPVWKSKDGSEW